MQDNCTVCLVQFGENFPVRSSFHVSAVQMELGCLVRAPLDSFQSTLILWLHNAAIFMIAAPGSNPTDEMALHVGRPV